MTPTSIVVAGSGSSASIRADGGVDFAAATSLSLNGVFTSEYDNYMISIRSVSVSGSTIDSRLRLAGTDSTSGYTYQLLQASGTSISGARSGTYNFAPIGNTGPTQRNGDQCFVYGPALAQPTAFRNLSARGQSDAVIADWANTHSTSTAYDGISLFAGGAGNNFTGMVTVYGYTQ
jgi:hypothetical protein